VWVQYLDNAQHIFYKEHALANAFYSFTKSLAVIV
jgi:hypothetical protein